MGRGEPVILRGRHFAASTSGCRLAATTNGCVRRDPGRLLLTMSSTPAAITTGQRIHASVSTGSGSPGRVSETGERVRAGIVPKRRVGGVQVDR